MQALVSTPRTFERVAVVRELLGRRVPIAIVHAFSPAGAELAIVERYSVSADGKGLDAAGLDLLEKDARATMSLHHPNIAPVRDLWREGGELCVASEVVEGETLEELRRLGTGGKDLSIEVGVRVLVDLLAALSALHTLGAGALAHGEVTTTNAIVGFDGTTRLVRPFRGHVAGKVAEPDWFSYAAPELIRGGVADARADLYAVGVLLWETLSRRKLFPKATREGRAARSVPVGKPAAPADATWAAPLAAVAERALANDPTARYTSAAEMAAAVRLAVRSKLAMPPRVAAAVDKLASDKILARRNTNALPENAVPAISVRPSRPPMPPEAMRVLSTIRPSSRPPPVMPKEATPKPVLAVPKAPPLPSLAIDTSARTGPRPLAPPLKLAAVVEPPPKPAEIAPPEEVAPVSLDGAFVAFSEPSAPPLAPTLTPIVTAAPAHVIEPVIIPTSKTPRIAIAAAIIVVLFIALAAVIRVVSSSSNASNVDPPHPSGTAAAITATATTTATATATSTASAHPIATEAVTAVPSASATETAEPETTAAPADSSHHPHTRPRPTYDPMGI